MKSYLIENGCHYTELQICRNEDDGCLDVFEHCRDPDAIEYGYYRPQTWDWSQIRDVSAQSLWHMSRRMHPVGPIDFGVPEHVPATPIIAAVATPMFYLVAGAPIFERFDPSLFRLVWVLQDLATVVRVGLFMTDVDGAFFRITSREILTTQKTRFGIFMLPYLVL